MGGIGSGAKRTASTADVEDMLALDIRVLRRLGVLRAGECIIDTVHWSRRGLSTASARLRTDLSMIERGGVMTITGAMPAGAITQHVAIELVPSGYGGHRCYFVCPVTAERCELLYYAEGRFVSRHAQRLTYATQNMNDLSRARRKVSRLRSRLEGEEGCRRPRGHNRIEIARRLERAAIRAHALYLDRLQSHMDRSDSRY